MRFLLRWCGVAAAAAYAGGRGWSSGSAAFPGAALSRGTPRSAAARTGRATAAVLRRAVRVRNPVRRAAARRVRRRRRRLAVDRLRAGLLRRRLGLLGLCALRAHGLLARPRGERLPVGDRLLLLLRLLGVDPP